MRRNNHSYIGSAAGPFAVDGRHGEHSDEYLTACDICYRVGLTAINFALDTPTNDASVARGFTRHFHNTF